MTSISGDATVSACAGDVSVTTVSGKQFVSCDANRASVSVVSGKAHVEGACEEWEINSVSGGVELIAPSPAQQDSAQHGQRQCPRDAAERYPRICRRYEQHERANRQ